MYNAEQPAPVSLSAASSGLYLANEAPRHAASSSLPSTSSPQEKPDPRGVSLHFSSPTRHKQATRRSVGPPNFCCPHVWLKSAHTATSMTVVSHSWCLTGRGNLIKWVTVFMNVYVECGGCLPASTGTLSVKVSLCCQGLSLPASPACHVCVRQMER